MPVRPAVLRPRGLPSVEALRRGVDADRRRRHPWRALYKTERWQRLRAAQLAIEPLCRLCLADDPPRVTPATVCDHVVPHRGDVGLFFDGPKQSLCKTCHDGRKQAAERAGKAVSE